ncbi:hypothetical protein SDRG_14935, partial [Saprolegnia diclina VS20]
MPPSPQSADAFLQDGSDAFHASLAAQLETSMGKAMPQMEIRFQDLSIAAEVSVATKDGHELPTLYNHVKKIARGLARKKRSIRKDVLHPMSGVFKPSTTTLLLGQPGSGKSSLMKILSGRFPMHKNITVGGTVTFNGAKSEDVKAQLPQFTAYMNQRDFHYPTLSVKETLAFAHACSGGAAVPQRVLDSLQYGSPEENAQAKAVIQSLYNVYPDIITRQMGLKICEDTIVGNAMLRGVSGGERKRVTVGEMEFGMKQVSFMDEISTGLDSAAAYDIVKSQKSMAASLKKTIVIALLQPSPELYNLFDEVLLMNEGHVMYHGARSLALEYFESLGFKCPPKRDVADFLLDLGTPQQDQYVVDGATSVPRTPSDYADVFRRSAIFAEMMSHLEGPHHPLLLADAAKHMAEMPAYQVPYVESTQLLIARQLKVFLRNTAFVKSRFIMVLVMGLLYASTFYQVDSANPFVVLGVVFTSVLFLALGQVPLMPAVLESREIFYKQRWANFFRTSSFILAQSFTQVPFAFGETLVFGSIMYWMTGFVSEVGAFFVYLLLLFLTNLALTSWFFFLAVISPDLHIAKPVAMLSILFYILFAGFVLAPSIMPDYFIWIYWINPLSWCLRALAINQYSSDEFQVPVYTGVDYMKLKGDTMGNVMLKTFGLETDTIWIWYGAIYLAAIYVVFLALSYLALEYKRYDAPENVSVAGNKADDEEDVGDVYVKAPKTPTDVTHATEDVAMKRLTIGVELAAAPSILFLDEPTSGLDARSAKIIMTGIRKIASTGRTVVCTIHQPSTEVFEMFDSLLLLKRGGETVFFGDLGTHAIQLIQYFKSIPNTPPLIEGANPATWMLEVIGAGVEAKSTNLPPNDYVQIFNGSHERGLLVAALERHAVPHSSLPELTFAKKRAASSLTQFKMVTQRFFRMYWRTPSYNYTRAMLSIILALLFGLVYRGVDYTTYVGATGGVGMIFLTSLFMGIISFNSVLPLATEERASFYRERASQTYSAFWYLVGGTVVEIPYVFVTTFVFCVIFYPFVGFNESIGACLFYGLNVSFLVLMNVYFGQLMAYAMPRVEVAAIIGTLFNSFFFLFMGYNPPSSQIPTGYKWLHHVIPAKYSVALLVAETFAKCTD